MLRHIQENIQTLLNAHGSDISNEMALAVLESGIWRNSFEGLQIRPIADHKHVFRVHATTSDGDFFITVIRRHHHIAEAKG